MTQGTQIAHEAPDLIPGQRRAERRHPVAPVHDVTPGGDRIEQRIVGASGHIRLVRVRRRTHGKVRRVIPIPLAADPVTWGAGPRIERGARSGLRAVGPGGGRWRRWTWRGTGRGAGRLPLHQETRDQLERGRTHGHARHDRAGHESLGVPDHGVHVSRLATPLQLGQARPDTASFTSELVAAEAGQSVLQEPLRLGCLERRQGPGNEPLCGRFTLSPGQVQRGEERKNHGQRPLKGCASYTARAGRARRAAA